MPKYLPFVSRRGALLLILFAACLQIAQAVGIPITATKRDILLIDANGNGLVSPGRGQTRECFLRLRTLWL
jgi:hypothetical protein